jgi:D-glycero-D-manno-heptose 1,7-bisphosphate phosphatase
MQPAVFLDRDGTMVHDVGYLNRLEDLRWFPYTIDAIRMLNRAGFLVLVTTNQGGIGLGHLPESFVDETHVAMQETAGAGGARIDGWFYCPHHPRAEIAALRVACECRKPGPGMVRQAQSRFPIDLARSFVVGDKVSDLGMAESVGARAVLVRTGYGEAIARRHGGAPPSAAHVAADLMEATSWILLQAGRQRTPS